MAQFRRCRQGIALHRQQIERNRRKCPVRHSESLRKGNLEDAVHHPWVAYIVADRRERDPRSEIRGKMKKYLTTEPSDS